MACPGPVAAAVAQPCSSSTEAPGAAAAAAHDVVDRLALPPLNQEVLVLPVANGEQDASCCC